MSDEGPEPATKLAVIFVFVVAVFVLLAVRSEIQASDIRENSRLIEQARATQRYESCIGGAVVLTKFNVLQQQLANLDRQAIAGDPTDESRLNHIRERRARVYENALLPIPDCEVLKP